MRYNTQFNQQFNSHEFDQLDVEGFEELDTLGIAPLIACTFDTIQHGKGLHRSGIDRIKKHGPMYALTETWINLPYILTGIANKILPKIDVSELSEEAKIIRPEHRGGELRGVPSDPGGLARIIALFHGNNVKKVSNKWKHDLEQKRNYNQMKIYKSVTELEERLEERIGSRSDLDIQDYSDLLQDNRHTAHGFATRETNFHDITDLYGDLATEYGELFDRAELELIVKNVEIQSREHSNKHAFTRKYQKRIKKKIGEASTNPELGTWHIHQTTLRENIEDRLGALKSVEPSTYAIVAGVVVAGLFGLALNKGTFALLNYWDKNRESELADIIFKEQEVGPAAALEFAQYGANAAFWGDEGYKRLWIDEEDVNAPLENDPVENDVNDGADDESVAQERMLRALADSQLMNLMWDNLIWAS